MITVGIDGDKDLATKLKRIGADALPDTMKILNKTAAELEAGVKLAIQQAPKTGMVYKRGNVSHRASSPGQSPASDTGDLLKSVYHQKARKTFLGAFAAVGSRLVYALYLEYGTRHMKPRPVWRKEAKKVQVVLIARLEAYLRKATQ